MGTRYNWQTGGWEDDGLGINQIRPQQVLGQNLGGQSPQSQYDSSDMGEGSNVMGNVYPQPQIPQTRIPQIAQQSQPAMRDTGNATTDLQQIMDIYDKRYTPSTVASDRLNRLIDSPPQYQGRGMGMSILGGIAALKDPKAAQEMLDQPYTRAREAWRDQVVPAQSAATLENQQNVNERTLAGNMATNVYNAKRLDEQRARDEARASTTQSINDAKIFKMQHPDWKFDAHSSTTVLAEDPATGQIHDTGYSTIHMNEGDKISMETMGKVAVANIQQGGMNDRAAAERQAMLDRQERMFYFQNATNAMRAGQQEQLKQTPSGGNLNDPKQIAGAISNKLMAATAVNPQYAKFTKQLPDGSLVFAPRPASGWFSGGRTTPEQTEYDNFKRGVLGVQLGPDADQQSPPPTGTGTGIAPGPGVSIQPPATPAYKPGPTRAEQQQQINLGYQFPWQGPVQPKGPYKPGLTRAEQQQQINTAMQQQYGQGQHPQETGTMIRDVATGAQYSDTPENMQKAVASGKYQWVK